MTDICTGRLFRIACRDESFRRAMILRLSVSEWCEVHIVSRGEKKREDLATRCNDKKLQPHTNVWGAGRVGWIWASLRTEVHRLWETKPCEMDRLGRVSAGISSQPREPDKRVSQYE